MDLSYSVGIPVRNEQNNIESNIESILNQCISPNNIFVCVNGSTDNTYKIVDNISKEEDKVKLLTSDPGKPNAWNRIITETQDNLMMFCDGDVIVEKNSAKNLLSNLKEDSNLALVGGSNAYFSTDEQTFFSKYFTENIQGKPIKPDWVCGRLYIADIEKLFQLANKLEIELMPTEIINEDGFLELITTGHREIIESAYNLSNQVTSFHDWKIGLKRVLAGQKQIKDKYPELFGNSDFSKKRLKNYYERFNEIEDWRKKVGVTSLFVLRTTLNLYYKISNQLEYNNIWEETKSSKEKIK